MGGKTEEERKSIYGKLRQRESEGRRKRIGRRIARRERERCEAKREFQGKEKRLKGYRKEGRKGGNRGGPRKRGRKGVLGFKGAWEKFAGKEEIGTDEKTSSERRGRESCRKGER